MVKDCKSCGREMVSEEDFEGKLSEVPYCSDCADHRGELLSRGAVREKLVDRIMNKKDVDNRRRARKYVEQKLDSMPAWQDN